MHDTGQLPRSFSARDALNDRTLESLGDQKCASQFYDVELTAYKAVQQRAVWAAISEQRQDYLSPAAEQKQDVRA
jgi:hypothetical protein